MILALGVAVLGGLGASMRYVLDTVITRAVGRGLPWGTLAVNLLGSLLVGIVVGLTIRGTLHQSAVALLSTGFLGGFTTASTLSVEGAQLFMLKAWWHALVVTGGTMAVALGVGLATATLAT